MLDVVRSFSERGGEGGKEGEMLHYLYIEDVGRGGTV